MSRLFRIGICLACALLCSSAYADGAKSERTTSASKKKKAPKEAKVLVTGSRIPQGRDRLGPIPTTHSPVVVMTRSDIDRTGRMTVGGVLSTHPSIR